VTVAPAKTAAKRSGRAASGGRASPPPFRPVQLATLVDNVPAGDRWLHEMKYDGYRILIAVGGGETRAYTRSGLDWSDRFQSILAEVAKLKVNSALIDGEAVVLDENGKSSFQALQGALKGAPGTIDYFAFDLLELDGEDLTSLPLLERKERLRAILPEGNPHLRYSDHIRGSGEKLLAPILRRRPRGGHLQARHRQICRLARWQLGQDQVHQAPGVRRGRLDAVRQVADLPFADPRRA
jgi:bifunctional non-homologous end joining protein LigD